MERNSDSLENRIALVLGRMMLRFAALEAVTRSTLHQVLDEIDENEVTTLTSELSFRQVRAVLIALLKQRNSDSEYVDSVRRLMKRAEQLEARRNALTHSFWIYSHLPAAMGREKRKVTDKGVFKIDYEEFPSVDSLDAFVSDIDQLAQEIAYSWISEHLGVEVTVSSTPKAGQQ